MLNHQIILRWDPKNNLVSVEHVHEPTTYQANVGDLITFIADPPVNAPARLEVTFGPKGSNFSPSASVITDSQGHRVEILGSYPFACAVVDADGTRRDQGAGDETKHPKK